MAFGIVGLADPQGLTKFINGIPGESMSTIVNIPATIIGSAVFMIIVGSVILVFGFLGCAGAWCMVKWMLFIYWVLLVLLLLAEIALIIVAAVSPGKVEATVKETLSKSLKDDFKPVSINGDNITLPTTALAAAWVSMQFEVGCCGANNYSDFTTFPWNKTFVIQGKSIDAVVPPSCCKLEGNRRVPSTIQGSFKDIETCLKGQNTEYFYTEGCYKGVTELMVQYSYVPIIIVAIIIFIEIVAIAASVYLWKSNDRKKEIA